MPRVNRRGVGIVTGTPDPLRISLAAVGAGDGDPIVFIGMHDPQPCYARDRKARQIIVAGVTCEHVAEAADGTWIYERRAT